jgi:hypothetical protein
MERLHVNLRHFRRALLLLSPVGLFFGACRAAHGQEVQAAQERIGRKFSVNAADDDYNPRHFLFSPEVVSDAKDGRVRLAHSVLLADEMGATDIVQREPLSDCIWAKKIFVLDKAEVTAARIFLYGDAQRIRVNGKLLLNLEHNETLIRNAWTRAEVPPKYLKAGENEVVCSGTGTLLIEPSRQPGRSLKSIDGGRTWSKQMLGVKNNQQGEYLVRLRIGRYAPRGWAMSPVFDLWKGEPREVPMPAELVSCQDLAGLNRGQPEGTRLVPWLRTGTRPLPDPETWTYWVPLDKAYRPDATERRNRWAQLKFDLITERPQSTPRLPDQFDWSFDLRRDPSAQKDRFVVESSPRARQPQITSVSFVYEEPSARLKRLRERYQLDKVVAPGRTEMEHLMLLRHWVRNQWHTAWVNHPFSWYPPWDALRILEARDQTDCLTNCTHYAAVFTQCCLALGWNARHCILDLHCVTEVYVNQHDKWVMMDTGNSSVRADVALHFERQGVPLSALELHVAQRTSKTDGIQVVFTPAQLTAKIAAYCRPAPPAKKPLPPRPDVIPLANLPRYSVNFDGLDPYGRYAFPARNNYLTSLYPGELYNGWEHYYYDGYCWVGDSPDEPSISPEYSHHLPPTRASDIDWNLNWTRIHMARTSKPEELRIDVETLTPNLARLEKTAESAEGRPDSWEPTAPSFVWKLKRGRNALRVRSVNQWEKVGPETLRVVQWTPTVP